MGTRKTIRRLDIYYPELSYKIIGSAFDAYNELGGGHHEKYYQRALAGSFLKNNLKFKEQVFCPIFYNAKMIGKKYLDFLVEDKVIVEIKKGYRFSKSHIDQVLEYLKMNGLRLAILINFTDKDVVFRRIINFS